VNCAEITTNIPRPAAYEIFSIERTLQLFYSPSLDFLGLRKPDHQGIKERYPRKSRYFIIVGQSFMKTVADSLSRQTLVMSFLVVSVSMTLKDPELPK